MNTTPDISHESADIADLLAAWRAHEDNRANGASIAELAASRDELDATRLIVRSSLALAS